MRIYDQVSLRDHVKSGCFQRRDGCGNSAIDSSIIFSPSTKFKQLFRSIQQSQRQYQLGIATLKSGADILELSIDKGLDRLTFASGAELRTESSRPRIVTAWVVFIP